MPHERLGGRQLWQWAVWPLLAAVLVLTLRPTPQASRAVAQTPWTCLVCGEGGGADVLMNLLLLLPLGVALGRAGWPRRRALLLVVLLPLLIEIIQGLWIPGRDATLSDFLANAMGGGLGIWLGSRPGPLRPPASLVLGVFVVQLCAAATLERPWITGLQPWRLLINPDVPGRPQYRQWVLRLRLGGVPLSTFNPDPGVRSDLRDNPTWLATLLWDPPSSEALTPIVRLEDSLHREIATVDRRGPFLGASLRDRASALRLRTPTLLVQPPDGTAAGDTLQLELDAPPGRLILTVTGATGTRLLDLHRGAQHGWSMINPFAVVHRSATAWLCWTLIWLLGWGLLLGWSTRGRRRPWIWGGSALVAFVVICQLGGAPATLLQVLALMLGWAVPTVSSRRVHQPQVVV